MSKSRHIVIKVGYYSFVVSIVLVLLLGFKELFIPVMLGTLATLVFEPIVDRLETRGLSRLNAVIVLYVAVSVLLVISGLLFLPHIVSQVRNLIEVYPSLVEKLRKLAVLLANATGLLGLVGAILVSLPACRVRPLRLFEMVLK